METGIAQAASLDPGGVDPGAAVIREGRVVCISGLCYHGTLKMFMYLTYVSLLYQCFLEEG
jgi:hypothetical protein